jgi:hypothetical protein
MLAGIIGYSYLLMIQWMMIRLRENDKSLREKNSVEKEVLLERWLWRDKEWMSILL